MGCASTLLTGRLRTLDAQALRPRDRHERVSQLLQSPSSPMGVCTMDFAGYGSSFYYGMSVIGEL